MVRVTVQSVTRHMQNLIGNKYADLTKIQEQMSTGKQLLRPSDNPIDVANVLKLKTTTSLLTQNGKNISDGLNFMNVTDTAMSSMNNIVQKIREKAIQGSSDTLAPSNRIYIQQETDQLFRQAISLLNTNYKGDFIFGGTQSKIEPFPVESSTATGISDYQKLKMSYFDSTATGIGFPAQITNAFDNSTMTNILPGSLKISNGATHFVEGTDYTVDYVNGTITPLTAGMVVDVSDGGTFLGPNYQAGAFSITFDRVGRGKDIFGSSVSNGGEILRQLEPGVTMAINTSGDDLITNRSTGTDLITTMILMQQHLIQNNQPGISSAITNIDNVSQAFYSAEGTNGARINRFESTQIRNEDQITQNNSLQSNLEDVDMAEAASKFSLSEMVYNAALKSAAMAIQPSLVNYL